MPIRPPEEIAQMAMDCIEAAESVMGGLPSKTGSLAAIRESVRQAQEEAYSEGYLAGQLTGKLSRQKVFMWSAFIIAVGSGLVYGVLAVVVG